MLQWTSQHGHIHRITIRILCLHHCCFFYPGLRNSWVVLLSFSLLAEASCVSAIEAARDVVADIGQEAASASSGLTDLAGCGITNSERDCQRVFAKKYSLSVPIPFSYLKTESGQEIPLLKLRHWVEYLVRNSCWHILTGLVRRDTTREGDILEAFWRTFRQIEPDHPIYELESQGRLSFRRTAPLCLHGDEGRGRRREAFMILSFRSLLGRGLHPEARVGKKLGIKRKWLKLKPNFRGHSFTSRYLFSAMRKSDYATKDTEGNFDLVLQKAAEEACYMCNVGVMDASGQKYNAVLLNVIGDWPFLKKSGPFQRSFMSVQKKKTTRNPPGGVCHQCLAGVAPWAWEQIGTRRPDWIATVATQSPFDGPSALASVPHVANRLEMMWAWDWFHCWHLGVGKCFLASSIALLSERENGSSIDERFASLTERYHSWCRANGQRRQVVKLSKDLVGWPSTNVFPTGIWHKGQLTTSLMAWLEAECSASDFSDDPFLQAVSEASGAIQNCIRQMYHEVIFLTPAKAERIANEGMRFLRRYLSLADMSKRSGRLLFVLQPKHHAVHHVMVSLWQSSQKNLPSLNPLTLSVQQDEDFIGRGARLSRRVTAMRPALQRTMERYLMSVYHEFEKAGYILQPSS